MNMINHTQIIAPAIFTFFIIRVRSPCASSSGVGGSGLFGGPGGNCGGVDGTESSESALKPGLYEIGLKREKQKDKPKMWIGNQGSGIKLN